MKLLSIAIFASLALACNSAAPVPLNSNARTAAPSNEKEKTVVAHTTENQTPPNLPAAGNSNSGAKSKWTQSGTPIDTKALDAAIAKAQMNLKSKPTNPELIKALSTAYFDRGVALTEAKQYASALGDYRRALKYDPENADAKSWINQIINIYDSLNKQYPPEGEEPLPLPFTKEK